VYSDVNKHLIFKAKAKNWTTKAIAKHWLDFVAKEVGLARYN